MKKPRSERKNYYENKLKTKIIQLGSKTYNYMKENGDFNLEELSKRFEKEHKEISQLYLKIKNREINNGNL